MEMRADQVGTIQRYRERCPAVVEAIQFTEDTLEAVYAFIHDHNGTTRYMSGAGSSFYLHPHKHSYGMAEEQTVQLGDWVLAYNGVYAMSADKFHATYVVIGGE